MSKKDKAELQTKHLRELGFNALVTYDSCEKYWSIYISKGGIWLNFSYTDKATTEQIISMLITALNV